jgi:hypothetical protein
MTGPLDPPVAHGRLDEAEARALTDAARLLDTEGPLDASDARTLTAAARDLAHLLWRMLLRLYEGDGWRVLGFKSWGGYYAAELGGHRSRGYRLLDAGRVLEQLEPDGFRGEGTPGSPLLTERTARELARARPHRAAGPQRRQTPTRQAGPAAATAAAGVDRARREVAVRARPGRVRPRAGAGALPGAARAARRGRG